MDELYPGMDAPIGIDLGDEFPRHRSNRRPPRTPEQIAKDNAFAEAWASQQGWDKPVKLPNRKKAAEMKVQPLTITTGVMPSLELREFGYKSISFGAFDRYEITLEAHGVSASRGLELADIEAIRNWCDAAMAAAGHQVAAE